MIAAIIQANLAAVNAALKAINEKPRSAPPAGAVKVRHPEPRRETYQPFPSDPDTLAPTLLVGGLLFGLFD